MLVDDRESDGRQVVVGQGFSLVRLILIDGLH